MRSINNRLSGRLAQISQQKSFPTGLINWVSMLIEGNNVSNYKSQNILTCAQISMYNFIPWTKPQASISKNMSKRCHSQNTETPVVTSTSILIYATVRSEILIDKLFHLGLCIPYKRILEITKDMTEYNLRQFKLNKVFIPEHSYKNLFTVIIKDNLLTAAKNHCHGTGLSMLSFPSKELPGELYTPNREMQTKRMSK